MAGANDSFFQTDRALVVAEIIKSATSLFLYGICILLAAQAFYFLSRREPSSRHVLICGIAVTLVFATARMLHQVVFTAVLLRLLYPVSGTTQAGKIMHGSIQLLLDVKLRSGNILLIVNNFAADSLFIYRCYVIWGQSRYKRWVVSIPLILLIFTTIFGSVAALLLPGVLGPTSALGIYSALVTNLLLTGFTAGHIWWTRRHLRVIGETKLVRRYGTAISMLIESSALYFAIVVIFLVARAVRGHAEFESPGLSVISAASSQLMNIAPALMIVRVSLTRSVDVDPTAQVNLNLVSRAY
ncbi:hypothetical protein DFH09DRAFT_267313 [Mycena vulgaris]|nr:hypothetical protein DFH09DRAFT_267313 [Mycena vulgaris]